MYVCAVFCQYITLLPRRDALRKEHARIKRVYEEKLENLEAERSGIVEDKTEVRFSYFSTKAVCSPS